jgi:hypothetical protein
MGLPPAKLSRRPGPVKPHTANRRHYRANDVSQTVTATKHGGR